MAVAVAEAEAETETEVDGVEGFDADTVLEKVVDLVIEIVELNEVESVLPADTLGLDENVVDTVVETEELPDSVAVLDIVEVCVETSQLKKLPAINSPRASFKASTKVPQSSVP